jgi:hypothetical protein
MIGCGGGGGGGGGGGEWTGSIWLRKRTGGGLL